MQKPPNNKLTNAANLRLANVFHEHWDDWVVAQKRTMKQCAVLLFEETGMRVTAGNVRGLVATLNTEFGEKYVWHARKVKPKPAVAPAAAGEPAFYAGLKALADRVEDTECAIDAARQTFKGLRDAANGLASKTGAAVKDLDARLVNLEAAVVRRLNALEERVQKQHEGLLQITPGYRAAQAFEGWSRSSDERLAAVAQRVLALEETGMPDDKPLFNGRRHS